MKTNVYVAQNMLYCAKDRIFVRIAKDKWLPFALALSLEPVLICLCIR